MSADFESALEKARAVAAKLCQGQQSSGGQAAAPVHPPAQINPTSTGINYTNTINNNTLANNLGNGANSLKRQFQDDDSIVGNLKKMAYSNTSLAGSDETSNGSSNMSQNNRMGQQQQRSSNGNTIFKPTQLYLDGVIINGEKILDCLLPGSKVGFVIGKNGDMIRQLQDRASVKMVVIQQSSEVCDGQKQLRISGEPSKVDHASQLVRELLEEKEKEMLKYSQRPKHNNHYQSNNEYGPRGGNAGGGSYLEMPVSPQYIGLVIGKNGESIKRISQDSGAKVSVDVSKTDPTGMKICQISANNPASVSMAADMIQDILNNAMNNKRAPPPGTEEVKVSVPQNKTGIVIGKGGETIRALKLQAGCNIELQKNSKGIFYIRGPADRIQYAQQLIGEKIGGQVTVISSTMQNNPPAPAAASAYADPYQWASAAQSTAPYAGYPGMAAPVPASNPTAVAAAQDPNAAYYQAYYQAYYSQMQQQQMAQQALPLNSAASINPATGQQTANTVPQPVAPAAAAATAAQTTGPAAAEGTEDYSAQWAAYYRYYGMEEQAKMYEEMAKKNKAAAAANPTST